MVSCGSGKIGWVFVNKIESVCVFIGLSSLFKILIFFVVVGIDCLPSIDCIFAFLIVYCLLFIVLFTLLIVLWVLPFLFHSFFT